MNEISSIGLFSIIQDNENNNKNDIDKPLGCDYCKIPIIQAHFDGFVFCEQCESFIMKKCDKEPYFVILRELYKDAVKKDIRINELEHRLLLLEGLNITI